MKNHIRTIALATGVAALAALGAAGSAQAAPVGVSVGISAPGIAVGFSNGPYYRGAVYPRYYAAPQVVYAAPAPVYYSGPAPVYYDQAYVPGVVYPASYWVGWRPGFVRYSGHWVHPGYVHGGGHWRH